MQIIPHVTDEIKRRLYAMDDGQTDVVIAEIGGTVGDIESQPYLEAIRQVAAEQGRENVLYIHVPLVVSIPGSGELKSKPTQHSVKELLSVGIQPDILVCRTDSPLPEDMRKKIALFCNVSEDCVIPNLTASTLYEVPLLLEREGLCRVVCRKLGLGAGEPDMRHWQELVTQIHAAEQRHVTIALVGKYTELHDAYLSVAESLFHAGTACGAQVDIQWVDSQHLTAENLTETLCGCSGILVPGGFGDRGIEGMILAAQYAREKGIPYLGICLGMQIAVIEFARHAAGWADAHSAEFSAVTAHPVIDLMPDQVGVTAKGGTMRLGKYPCVLAEGTKAREAYGQREIWERHRHRYECSNVFRPGAGGRGPAGGGYVAGWPSGGDGGDTGPSVVRGLPVPPGVQESRTGPIPCSAALWPQRWHSNKEAQKARPCGRAFALSASGLHGRGGSRVEIIRPVAAPVVDILDKPVEVILHLGVGLRRYGVHLLREDVLPAVDLLLGQVAAAFHSAVQVGVVVHHGVVLHPHGDIDHLRAGQEAPEQTSMSPP